ncbi:MAG: tetraacyldisaccharide 4'-kinase [Candidatus Muiribacteriota bacterium]
MKRDFIYKDKGLFLNLFLRLLSFLYYFLHKIKYNLYYFNILPKTRSSSFIISVGNITAGGTGKTPFVIYAVKKLKQRNFSVVVLQRAYKSDKKYGEVFDGRNFLMTVKECGDEPYLMALNTDVPVFIAKKRVKILKTIEKKYNPDFILLDDGFQYWRLERNIDIVCVDGKELFYNKKILPSGILREPLNNIKRADYVVLKNDGRVSENIKTEKYLNLFTQNKRFFLMNYFFTLNKKIEYEKKILLLAGIAKPESFFSCVEKIEELKNITFYKIPFEDHQIYTSKIISNIKKIMKEKKISTIITTEKDYWKIKNYFNRIFYLKVNTFIEGGEKLVEKIQNSYNNWRS